VRRDIPQGNDNNNSSHYRGEVSCEVSLSDANLDDSSDDQSDGPQGDQSDDPQGDQSDDPQGDQSDSSSDDSNGSEGTRTSVAIARLAGHTSKTVGQHLERKRSKLDSGEASKRRLVQDLRTKGENNSDKADQLEKEVTVTFDNKRRNLHEQEAIVKATLFPDTFDNEGQEGSTVIPKDSQRESSLDSDSWAEPTRETKSYKDSKADSDGDSLTGNDMNIDLKPEDDNNGSGSGPSGLGPSGSGPSGSGNGGFGVSGSGPSGSGVSGPEGGGNNSDSENIYHAKPIGNQDLTLVNLSRLDFVLEKQACVSIYDTSCD